MSRAAAWAAWLPVFLLVAAAALAQSPAPQYKPAEYNIVSLQADAQREVDNDVMTAVLFAELSDTDSAKLAQSLNTVINAALQVAGQAKAVRTRSGNYRTYPVYDNRRRLTEWRGRAELRLESADFGAASSLIGQLQSTLQVASIGFSVSPAVRQRVQDELMVEALATFRARAEVAQKALGGRSFKVRQVNIGSGFSGPQPFAAESRSLAASAPQLEGGASRISVTASGSVEID
jgi:predicted secreted protein